jgi:hypothetical protein
MPEFLELLLPLLHVVEVSLLDLLLVLLLVLFKLLLPFDEYLLQQVRLLLHLESLYCDLLLLRLLTLCSLLMVRVKLGQKEQRRGVFL